MQSSSLEMEVVHLPVTKMKKILFLMVLIASVSSVLAFDLNHIGNDTIVSCYQETTNLNNGTDGDCILNYAGSYIASGAWIASQENTMAYDGDFSTYGQGSNGVDGNLLVTYKKPLNVFNATIHYKSNTIDSNFSIPKDCFTQPNITLKIQAIAGLNNNNNILSCYDGSTYTVIYESDLYSGNKIYEEGIYWNVSENYTIENITIDAVSDIQIGADDYFCETDVNSCTGAGDTSFNTYAYINPNDAGWIFLNYTTIPKWFLYANTTIKTRTNLAEGELFCNYQDDIGFVHLVGTIPDSSNSDALNTFNLPYDCINKTEVQLSIYLHQTGTGSGVLRFYNLNITSTNRTIRRYLSIPSLIKITNAYLNVTSNSTGIYNSTITVGIGGNPFWNYANQFNSINSKTNNFAGQLNQYLDSCTFVNGYCNVPLSFHSDTVGLFGYSGIQISNTGFLENSINYSSSVNETDVENFTLNLTYDPSVYSSISVNFTYNNTVYTSSILTFSDDRIITNSVPIPSVVEDYTNKSFYWTVYLTNSSGTYAFNSSINNQSIRKLTRLLVDTSCGAGLSVGFNFTGFNEQDLTPKNFNAKYIFKYGLGGNTTAYNINGSFTDVPFFYVCINNSQGYFSIGYAEVQYDYTAFEARRYYVFSNTRLTNITTNIPLYELDATNSTSFLVTARSTNLVNYVGYYIGLLRWYPSINSYKLVEMSKTDDKGESVLHVKTEDVDYRLAIYAPDGTLIKLFEPIRMICQANPCTYSLIVEPSPLQLSQWTSIESDLEFNRTTKVFTFTWNDPSQVEQTMNLSVFKGDDVICSSSASGYTGILHCDISAYSGLVYARATRTASPETVIQELAENIRQTIIDAGGGALGLFIGACLLIFFALIGIFNPILVIVFAIISMIPLYFMGSIDVMMLAGIGVLGGIIIHFMRRAS